MLGHSCKLAVYKYVCTHGDLQQGLRVVPHGLLVTPPGLLALLPLLASSACTPPALPRPYITIQSFTCNKFLGHGHAAAQDRVMDAPRTGKAVNSARHVVMRNVARPLDI